MARWVMQEKGDLLPISDDQRCFFCDSKQWSWVYLLLKRAGLGAAIAVGDQLVRGDV